MTDILSRWLVDVKFRVCRVCRDCLIFQVIIAHVHVVHCYMKNNM